MYVMTQTSHETRDDTLTLRRLGAELAAIYRDTLSSRLPSHLQSLVERLDDASGSMQAVPEA